MGDPIVIVGAGAAAVSAADGLRTAGFDGGIVLVGDEPLPPYERPPLSKSFLAGGTTLAALALRPESWYSEHDIDLRLGVRAVELDVAERVVELDDGSRLRFHRLLLATGGRPRRLPAIGAVQGVCYLRTAADADALATRLAGAGHVVVVGAGFVGAEVAATARLAGADVTIIEACDVPLQRVLGDELGRLYADIHRDEGVTLRLGEAVTAIEANGGEWILTTSAGGRLATDLVVVGIGLAPNTGLAERAGLRVENGVVVDQYCAASADGIYAAGDVANHYHPLFDRHVRVEHHDNALKQGHAAAGNMLGLRRAFMDPHWFWSDQYDYNLQYVGDSHGCDSHVVRGDLAARDFTAFFLRDGVLRAACAINRGRDILIARRLIGCRIEALALADEDLHLRALLDQHPVVSQSS